jgi:hypothetical protein
MRSRIVGADVGFGFDDAPRRSPPAHIAHYDPAEERSCDLDGGPGVECRTEGAWHSLGRVAIGPLEAEAAR